MDYSIVYNPAKSLLILQILYSKRNLFSLIVNKKKLFHYNLNMNLNILRGVYVNM